MSEHSPLLPCPFCGSKTIARHDTGACWLSCADCETEGPVSDSAAEAHGLWNRRVVVGAHAELVAALEEISGLDFGICGKIAADAIAKVRP